MIHRPLYIYSELFFDLKKYIYKSEYSCIYRCITHYILISKNDVYLCQFDRISFKKILTIKNIFSLPTCIIFRNVICQQVPKQVSH